ncbi:MAG: tandem-95 repeat protein, partial [Planctomycetaceae bacterium]|nr:tandem-95 repeat protein [Planctomycetaceae bacterium]
MSKRTRRQRLQKQRSSERNRGVETVRRLLRAEPLEDRLLLAADLGMDLNHWHNYVRATDVNQDGVTSPVDALVVINELNMGGPRNLALIDSGSPEGETAGRHFLDTNGDNHLTAADALGVIDALNGEGEHSPQVEFRISLTDTNDQPLPQNAGQSQVLLGDNYRMHVETKSINIPPSGVFAAYLDVDFNDAALFDVVVGETQRLTFSPVAISSGSNFTLTFQGEETAPIDITVVSTSNGLVLWPQIAGSIQAALEALPNIDAGDVVVEHAPIENLSDPSNDNPSIFTIRWQGPYIATDVPELSVNVSNVTAGDGSTVTGTIDELYPADSSNVGAFRSAIIVAVNAYQPPGSPFPTAITYNNAVTGAFVGNSFDDLGGFRGDSTFLDDSWFNVLSLDMVATSAGLATYQGTGAVRPGETGYPDGTGNAVLLMGSNDAVSVEEVLYGNSVSVNIVKPVDAQDDTLTIDEDAGLTSVDVLVNDVLAIEGTLAVESVSAGSAGGTVAIAGDALSINYTAANDFNGTETFTYVLTNGAGTTDTGTVTITVNAVNDAPANVVEDALSVNEDATLTFNAANSNQLSVSDIDADPAGVQTVVSVNNGTLVLTTGGGASVTDNGSAAVTISGTTAQVNAALDGMTYTPQTDFNGSDTLTMVTSDLGNTGTGGTLVDTDTVAISVAALNDSPENTVPGNQVLLNMPGAVDNLNLTGATAISVADVDADPAGVQVTLSLDNAGTLTVVSPGNATVGNNGIGGVTVSGTTAEVNGALGDVRYSVDDDNFWDETVVLTVATSDLGNTGSGGTLVDTDTVSIYVAPPSQPYAIDDVGNTTEDPGAALAVDVLANDLLGPNDAALAITEINGASVGVGATATTASGGTVTNNGTSLEYTPAADFNGDDAFTYTIASSPDAGDGPSTGNVTISVAAVNDAPVNVVPGSQLLNNLPGVTDELVFSSANGNPITVNDVDAATVEVTLSLDNTGSLTLPTTNGLQVSGNGSSTIVATGSPADINTALDGLKYAVADDNFYPETVTLTVA